MASLIDPRCDVNLYYMDNESLAVHCGRIEGCVTAFIFSLIVICIGCFIYLGMSRTKNHVTTHTDEESERKARSDRIKKYVLITIVVIFLLWLIFPFASGWINGRRWRGY